MARRNPRRRRRRRPPTLYGTPGDTGLSYEFYHTSTSHAETPSEAPTTAVAINPPPAPPAGVAPPAGAAEPAEPEKSLFNNWSYPARFGVATALLAGVKASEWNDNRRANQRAQQRLDSVQNWQRALQRTHSQDQTPISDYAVKRRVLPRYDRYGFAEGAYVPYQQNLPNTPVRRPPRNPRTPYLLDPVEDAVAYLLR